jgi:1-phosphatidylinositol-3-phosphate 5-kinase
MSKFEIQSVLDFAPNYFNYMKSCYQDKNPTVLAKIVGVYRIGFKNSQNNTASKLDILIMENLFYQRKISQKFDLKGSIRNRLASTSGKEQEDLVLLDENLVNSKLILCFQ